MVIFLSDEREIDTGRDFKNSEVLAKFVDKILRKHDDHQTVSYTCEILRYLKKFKQVQRSEHGRRADGFKNIQKYEGLTWCIASGNVCFLNCIFLIFQIYRNI